MPFRVVILGGGFGGLYAARALDRYGFGRERVQVTLVDAAPAFVFKPLLYELLTDELGEGDLAFPFEQVLEGSRIEWRRARVAGIDLDRKRVQLEPPPGGDGAPGELEFDAAAIALGSAPDWHGLPGLAEHTVAASSIAAFRAIRERLVALNRGPERERPSTVAVCGAGPSGVEIACKLADRFAAGAARNGRAERRVLLIEAADHILPGFGEELKARAVAKLAEKRVEVRLRTPVRSAHAGGLVVGARGGPPETIDAGLVIWTAGQGPAPVVRGLPVEHDPAGRLLVPATLEIPGRPGVFALGDNARCTLEGAEAPPATAQVAVQQAAVVARNLAARVEGRGLRSFRYYPLAETLTLGKGYDILQVLGVRLEGLPAHLVRRLLYLARLPGGWRQKANTGARWGFRLATEALEAGFGALFKKRASVEEPRRGE